MSVRINGSGFAITSCLSTIPPPRKNIDHIYSVIAKAYLSIEDAIKKLNISLCASNNPRHTFVKIIFVI